MPPYPPPGKKSTGLRTLCVFRADETTKANFIPIEITSSGLPLQVGTTRASRTVLLRLTEPSAAAAVVLCQPVWLELGTQEVPRRGDF